MKEKYDRWRALVQGASNTNQSIFIYFLGVLSSFSLQREADEDWQTFSSTTLWLRVSLLRLHSIMLHIHTARLLIFTEGQKGNYCIFCWLNTFSVYVSIFWALFYCTCWRSETCSDISISVLPPLILAKLLSLLKDYGVDSWPTCLNLSPQLNVPVMSHQTRWISVLSGLTITLTFTTANRRQLVLSNRVFLSHNVTLPDECLQLGTE